MRAKVVVVIVGLGLLIFGALFALHQTAERPGNSSRPAPGEPVVISKAQPVVEPIVASSTNVPQSDPQPTGPSEDAHKSYVEQRSAQLMDLAMNDDRASLDTILSELTNRDPEIRKAALDAAIQFGSRDAIPKLADAASQTDDASEKTALNDAIEFLKLPSLTEISAQSHKPPGNAQAPRPAHKLVLSKQALPAATPDQ